MQFMLLIHGDETAMNAATPVDATGMSADYAAFNAALIKAGAMRGGERLRSTASARSVRKRNGKTEIIEGPYAETREQFGGYYTIEAASMDDALDWASRCPAAEHGIVEVRPIWEIAK